MLSCMLLCLLIVSRREFVENSFDVMHPLDVDAPMHASLLTFHFGAGLADSQVSLHINFTSYFN